MKQFTCQICGRIFTHIKHLKLHKISPKDYYDLYIRKPNEGFCEYCHKEAKFISLQHGYRNTCGYSCAGKLRELNRTDEQILAANEKRKQTYLKNYGTEHPMKNENVKQKLVNTNIVRYGTPSVWSSGCIVRDKLEQTMIERYGGVGYGSNKNYISDYHTNASKARKNYTLEIEKQYNATTQSHLTKRFGQGFLSADIIPDEAIIYNKEHHLKLIKNEYIPYIEAYTHRYRYGKTSQEKLITECIKSVYNKTIICNARKPIYPKEIDVYLPELKTGIEFNGTRWHSIELGTRKAYHLDKSLLCREKGIRLIHIYGFEDLDEQLKLLQDLILGQDNYPKNDFNKNNLIENIPKPEIVYKDDQYTIYGAGKLY